MTVECTVPIKKEDFDFTIPDLSGMNIDQIFNWSQGLIHLGYNVGEIWKRFLEEEDKFKDGDLYRKLVPDVGFKTDINLVELERLIGFPTKCLDLILNLREISSSNSKKEFLINYINENFIDFETEMLIKFLSLVLSDVYTYDVTIKALNTSAPIKSQNNWFHHIILELEAIGLSNLTPTEKKQRIVALWENAIPQTRELISMIIDRDLKCKMQAKTFYEIFKDSSLGQISIIPYQRCEKEDKFEARAAYPVLVQEKADGKFQNVIYSKDESFCLNRSGKKSYINMKEEFDNFNDCTNYLSSMWGIPAWFRGEALIKLPGFNTSGVNILDVPVLDRKIGNGLLNSYGNRFETYKNDMTKINEKIKKKGVNTLLLKLFKQFIEWEIVKENIIVQLWDVIPYNQYITLSTNFNVKLAYEYGNDFIQNYNKWCLETNRSPKLFLIHTEFANDIDMVYSIYNKMLKMKKEGIVAKNLKAIIEHGTSNQGIHKFKDFLECDLRVIGFVPGNKNFVGGIGSLMCESECGLLRVAVGGLETHQRGFERIDLSNSALGIRLFENWDNNCYNGLIVNVKFNGLSKDKTGKPSLSHPSLVEFRNDVNKAETLDEIKAKKSKK